MRAIALQLERLRRHHDVSMRTYDEVSLLDLSHTLRIWADLKKRLPIVAPVFGTTLAFKSARPARKVLRAVKEHKFIFAFMSDLVLTRASKNQLGFTGEGIRPGTDATVGASAKFNPDGSLEIKNYFYISASQEGRPSSALGTADTSRGNFGQWLGSEVVRLRFSGASGALETTSISRETMIRRVANVLDGSHPSGSGAEDEYEHVADPAIAYLMKYAVSGLPVPYFVLLSAAQDLLSIAPRLLEQTGAGEA